MNADDRTGDEQRTLDKLGEALGYDPQRQPAPARVAALRAAAEQERARRQQPDGGSGSRRGGTAEDTVVRLPRRRELLLGGIAASVGAVAGFGGRELLADETSTELTEPIPLAGLPSGVQADARLINHSWGTELLLDVSGLSDGETYRVVYSGTSGSPVDAGSFLGVADTLMKCRFNAAPLRAEVSAIVVFDAADAEVMRADLT